MIAGPILDRNGPRPLLLLGGTVCSLCFWGLSLQSSLWLFWALCILNGLLGWSFFGPQVVSSTLSKWFIQKRGWALAIGSTGVPLGGLITPLAMTAVVAFSGWRGGYMTLAVFVAVVIIPIAFMMRRQPEDHGYSQTAQKTTSELGRLPQKLTRQRPIANPHTCHPDPGVLATDSRVWVNQAALMAVLIHAFPFVTESGFDRNLAAMVSQSTGSVTCVQGCMGRGVKSVQSSYSRPSSFRRFSNRSDPHFDRRINRTCAPLNGRILLLWFGFGGTIPLSEFTWAATSDGVHRTIRGASNPPTLLMQAVSRCSWEYGSISPAATIGHSGNHSVLLLAASLIATSKAPVD
ncbi:MAG: hypothetical protein CM1200mP27_10720 [Chloroflexota bacterium]|nr:MAG: hypothetical protein CM1200mP27_10720 [Chloroflexota bacterium]